MTEPSDAAVRATLHNAGHLWEATRAQLDALRVHGLVNAEAPALPAWPTLTAHQAAIFINGAGPALFALIRLMEAVAEHDHA